VEQLKEYAEHDMSEWEFRYGTLFMPSDTIEELIKFNAPIEIDLTYSSKGDVIEVKFYELDEEEETKTAIYNDLGNFFLKSEYLTDGNVLSVAEGKNSVYSVEAFSIISDDMDAGYVRLYTSSKVKPETISNTFTDVGKNHWASDEVDFAYSHGMIAGYDDGSFGPSNTITRAQASLILYRAANCPASSGGTAYDDVDPYSWYTKAIFWVSSNGYVNSKTSSTFSPDTEISRADQVLMLYRYAKACGYDVSASTRLTRFKDAGTIRTTEQLTAMSWAVAVGIVEGDSTGKLNPTGGTTRAAFCAMMERFVSWCVVVDADVEEI
jgi:hypothetical protein